MQNGVMKLGQRITSANRCFLGSQWGNILLVLASVLLLTCISTSAKADDAETARIKLNQMGIQYNEATFVQKAGQGDVVAVNLFLQAGMDPNHAQVKNITAYMAAQKGRNAEVIKLIESKGGKPRFKEMPGGIIIDYMNDLEWTVFPTKMSWKAADHWAKNMGSGWRLPTRDELKSLYYPQSGGVDPIFKPQYPLTIWFSSMYENARLDRRGIYEGLHRSAAYTAYAVRTYQPGPEKAPSVR